MVLVVVGRKCHTKLRVCNCQAFFKVVALTQTGIHDVVDDRFGSRAHDHDQSLALPVVGLFGVIKVSWADKRQQCMTHDKGRLTSSLLGALRHQRHRHQPARSMPRRRAAPCPPTAPSWRHRQCSHGSPSPRCPCSWQQSQCHHRQ